MRHKQPTRAFTIIETLVSIALVATLIGLLLPSLASVRDDASELKALATIGSHAKVMSVYLADNRDAFPCLVDPRATSATYFIAGEPYTINGYFGQVFVWHFGLSEMYYGSQLLGPLFQRPGRDDDWRVTDYRYSASFLADPGFWNYDDRRGPEQWRGQRAHAVRYPSAKALLADERIMDGINGHSGVIALVDTSARHVDRSDLTAPFPPGEGEWPGTWSSGRPAIHTVNGVLGRDIP